MNETKHTLHNHVFLFVSFDAPRECCQVETQIRSSYVSLKQKESDGQNNFVFIFLIVKLNKIDSLVEQTTKCK